MLGIVAVLVVVAGVAASPASAAEVCPVPVTPGFNFQSLTASDVPCPEARELALHVIKGSTPADWSCTETVRGLRNVSYACVDRLIATRRVDFTYYVL